MEMVIVTGMSGAGKSTVVDTMEDIGYYCMDNLPVQLIGKVIDLATQSEIGIEKMVLVIDVRSGHLDRLGAELAKLDHTKYRLLFLDCADDVLMRRYKETRRKHPLAEVSNPSVRDAIRRERALFAASGIEPDFTIDTTSLSVMKLKEKVQELFLNDVKKGLLVTCMSFGFKHGYPSEADLTFDVRCLPNPFYIESLKHQTGLDAPVHDYVMKFDQSKELLQKLTDLIDFLMPLYVKEGKSQLVIAFGCTGGKHRSVTFAEEMYRHLQQQGLLVSVNHRDIMK